MARTGPKFGYRAAHAVVEFLLNRLAAALILVVSLPVFLVLYFLVFVLDGPPVFYVGWRLGKNRKRFQMYKFRTLRLNAEQIVGAELLSPKHRLTTPVGQFLRDSRLDELPQLLNILKGDMNFVGPRPVRPLVYERVCRFIRNYDIRFRVRPGLLGLSQLVTPHNTPKRIRSMIDNLLIRKRRELKWEVWYVVLTALLVIRASAVQTNRFLRKRLMEETILRRYKEQRSLDRVTPAEGRVHFSVNGTELTAQLVDINEEAFLMRAPLKLPEGYVGEFTLQVTPSGGVKRRGVRKAKCTGRIYRETQAEDGAYSYVIVYDAYSQLNFYNVHQYFLERSVA